MTHDQLVIAIDAILPQTQCRQCGFEGCRPYAAAIAEGRADINQCPPGGETGILKLSILMGISPKPLNPVHGVTKPRAVAFIHEHACIGCTLCIAACPVDAIVGATRQAHTVISDECTGCELCLAPCPMDCIVMVPPELRAAGGPGATAVTARGYPSGEDEKKAADRARARYQFRSKRFDRDRREKEDLRSRKVELPKFERNSVDVTNRKKAMVQAALERAKAARAGPDGSDK
jgi:electron transport complex protein RnfB